MRKLAFLILLLTPLSALAQGGLIRDIVLQKKTLANPNITYAQPVVGAVIRVCTGGGIPCSPLASIYSNETLTSALSNPTASDINGNFYFWVGPGTYTVGITAGGVTANFSYTASVNTAIGSITDGEFLYSDNGVIKGSTDVKFSDAVGNNQLQLIAGKLRFGSLTTGASIQNQGVTNFDFLAENQADFRFGAISDENSRFRFQTENNGQFFFNVSSSPAVFNLNDGLNAAGVFQGPKLQVGQSSPEGVVTARVGSLFVRTDGGAGTNLYTKQTGTGNTGWSSLPVARGSTGTGLPNSHTVVGSCTLGTDCAVTLTGAAVYTANTSYTCVAQDQTAAAATRIVQSSGSAFTITGTGTDVIRYFCDGN